MPKKGKKILEVCFGKKLSKKRKIIIGAFIALVFLIFFAILGVYSYKYFKPSILGAGIRNVLEDDNEQGIYINKENKTSEYNITHKINSGGGGGGGGGGSSGDTTPSCTTGSWVNTNTFGCMNNTRQEQQTRNVCGSEASEQWIENLCGTGYICYQDTGAPENLCINETQSCIDSDGLDYDINGSVNHSSIIYTDVCLDLFNVTEYYCYYNSTSEQTEVKNQTYECSNPCLNGACIPICISTQEICDGLDNDCDGLIDEDEFDNPLNQSCYSGPAETENIGLCAAGIQTCILGIWDTCVGEVIPQTEICDAGLLDEDCDDSNNEGCVCIIGETQDCGSDVGECSYGTQTCDITGTWGSCVGEAGPSLEICDGLDNDCTGVADDYDFGQTTCGLGECLHTIDNCVSGITQTCNPLQGAVSEICEGLLDEDCDGVVDNGCICTIGETQICGTSVGECIPGLETCIDGDWGGVCEGETSPTQEICDGLDNNCNSVADDNPIDCAQDHCVSGSCVECINALECDDSISCTDDSCSSGNCVNTVNDANCDNGLWCDGIESCNALLDCQAGTVPIVDDSVSCTDDSCDEVNDTIVNNPNNGNCESWEYCDSVSDCTQSSCFDCEDCDDWWLWNDCSYSECHDSCNVLNECYFVGQLIGSENCVDLATACTSINICLEYSEEECVNNPCDVAPSANGCELDESNCVNAPYCGDGNIDIGEDCLTCPADVSCSEPNPYCVLGVCVECIASGNCDNGLFCDGVETCNGGSCQVGTAPNLDDFVACTIDSCDEINDVIVNTPDDNFCDNDLWCDGNEYCDAVLDCQNGIAQDCDDLISCTTDTCNEFNDECDYDTLGCSCSVQGPAPVECDDSNSCTDDICNSTLDCENINNDANSCDRGELCTENDRCSLGSCIADPVNIDDGIACTIDNCDEISGVTHITNDSLCDDANICTNNICNILTGCEFPFNTISCDDLIGCTDNDVCSLGVCAGTLNDTNCESWQYCDSVNDCVQSDCSNCEDCDDWWLWDDCPYDKCHNSCDVLNECYFVGEIAGSENCVDLSYACNNLISVCDDYSQEECNNDACGLGNCIWNSSLGICEVTTFPQDYISYWKLNENADDESGFNNGTLINGSYFNDAEKGWVLNLDGEGDKIKIPHNSNQAINNSGTWTFWLKLNTYDQQCFISKRDNWNSNNAWAFGVDFNGVMVKDDIIFEYSTNGTNKYEIGWNKTSIPLSEWVFVTFVYNSIDTTRNMRMYVNSIEIEPFFIENKNTSLFSSTSDIYIGAINNGSVGLLNGSIDDVMIFNRSLSKSEIQEIYNNQSQLVSICNNNLTESGETCDGSDLGVYGNGIDQCNNYNPIYSSGNLSCASDCLSYDTSGCIDLSVPICSYCGDGICNAGEDCNNCNIDCATGIPEGTCEVCFKAECDGSCEPQKEGPACADCNSTYCCGDGFCDFGYCGADCGESLVTACCGDGVCENNETSQNCPIDCSIMGILTIATLRDKYETGDKIWLTDPPEKEKFVSFPSKVLNKKISDSKNNKLLSDIELAYFSIPTGSIVDNLVIDKTFKSSIEIPLDYPDLVSSVVVSGKIDVFNPRAYARIILKNEEDEEFLILGSDSLILEKKVNFVNFCEETCSLNNEKIKSLVIEVSGASVYIDSLKIQSKDSPTSNKLKTNYKSKQEEIKIKKWNQKLAKDDTMWVAGKTSISSLSYNDKRKLFKNKRLPNLFGFEYYTEGIFELPRGDHPGPPTVFDPNSTGLPPDFDWRNVHGQNWVTPVTDQLSCGSCWAFGATSATEHLVNIFFNQHLDLDLSEQDALSCSGTGSCSGGFPSSALGYYRDVGVVDEACFPYTASDEPCSNKCTEPSELIQIGEQIFFYQNRSESALKRMILEQGAVSGGLPEWNHAMHLVGFGTIKEGDRIYNGSGGMASKIIDSNDSRIGDTYWIFKNSWGSSWGEGGFMKIHVESYYDIEFTTSLLGPVTSLNTYNIICEDNDNDSYCNWGISKTKPANCPEICGIEKDCDDSNKSLGPFDQNYNCIDISKPQSKIENTGYIDITGYLNMKIQKYQNLSWVDYELVISNQSKLVSDVVKLDFIFNPENVTINEAGTYRVYAEFVNGAGEIISTPAGDLVNNWEFEVIECIDFDNDSYSPVGGLCGYIDCNDSDENIYPGAYEYCNGIDEDCDTFTVDGLSEPWYDVACDGADSDFCEEGNFICTNGTKTCSDDTVDNLEPCNGLDSDCNNLTDDNCEMICGSVITEDFVLTEDLTDNGYTRCLSIGANDVSIDCNNHSIIDEGGGSVGIENMNYINASIKNCNIIGFGMGIHSIMAGTSIINNTLENYQDLFLIVTNPALVLENNIYGDTGITMFSTNLTAHNNNFNNSNLNIEIWDTLSHNLSLNYWGTTNCNEIRNKLDPNTTEFEPFLDNPFPYGAPIDCGSGSAGEGLPSSNPFAQIWNWIKRLLS